VRLMPFWSNSPAAWYRAAEAQFALRNVTSDIDKYYVVLGALSEANVDRVKHKVEQEPDEHSVLRIRDVLSRIRIRPLLHPGSGSRIWGVKKHRIPDPGSDLFFYKFCLLIPDPDSTIAPSQIPDPDPGSGG
jgi:hypothetical protein